MKREPKNKPLARGQMSEDQAECYRLLCDVFGGEHHVEQIKEWGYGIMCPHYGDLSTFDFDVLTRLVVLAHDRCVRVGVIPYRPRELAITLHKRTRDGGVSRRHPTLEQAVATVRRNGDEDDHGSGVGDDSLSA